MPMFEGRVPANLSFKKGCDESYKNAHLTTSSHKEKTNTPHVDTVRSGSHTKETTKRVKQ